MLSRGLVPVRIIRSFLTIVLYLGGTIIALAVVGLLLTAAFAGDGFRGDVATPVALGDRTFVPIVRLESDSPAALSSPALVGGVAELRFETDSRMLTVAGLGGIFVAAVIMLYAAWLMRGVLGRVLDARPFSPANVRAFHLLALLSVVGAIALQAIEIITARFVLSTVEVEGMALSPPFELDLSPFLLALMLEVLAAIFQHGADLEADQSLTI